MKKLKGFTLIELLIVIIIIGVLASLLMGNFFTSLKKGRDARRKADLGEIQKAIEMYYEDKRAYPTAGALFFGNKLCEISCGTGEKVYMQLVPQDPTSSSYSYNYCVSSDGQEYQLYTALENSLDPQIITPSPAVGPCSNPSYNCGTTLAKPCSFGISSSNALP